ncbi:Vacuolar protein-sorting-associated protein 33 [Malassezia obtusa]|uniref:Vacuolar protein-sorting-associated protein 33 n=1 Tax=Malassezia obtusa TaxID=76774 RepID=A0AAF0IT01_9BASI|nr:Vacuolar protein-sorting-associated protein 33 [Malassezia obtusa]
MDGDGAWDGVDVAPLVRLAQDGFVQALDSVPGAKTLLIDPTLAGPLGLLADVGALRQHGVEKMFWLEPARPGEASVLTAPTQQLLYLCRPETRWMRTIAAHFQADSTVHGENRQYAYAIAFVPHRTEPCLKFLREHSLLRSIAILDFGLEFNVLSPDLLSLEESGDFARTFLDHDHTTLFRSAQALMTIQSTYGLFPRIVGKGDMANRLCDLLVRQRREHFASDPGNAALQALSPQVDALIVLDRTVDVVTPLSTQLTYEGLIDEVLGVSNGFVEVDASWVGAAAPAAQGRSAAPVSAAKRKVRLDGADDPLFQDIKDNNFAVVGEKLHMVAKRISQDYQGRHDANTVEEIRAFVGRLGNLQSEHASLRLHTYMVEHLLATTRSERFRRILEIQQNLVAGFQLSQQLTAIEELVYLQVPALTVLRLACLACVVGATVRPKWLDAFKTSVVQAYGYEYLELLLALEQLQLLSVTQARPKGVRTSRFGDLHKPLRLIDDEVDESAPSDISYVFSGYAPLSIRLVQTISQHDRVLLARKKAQNERPAAARIAGWRGVDEAVVHWPGASFDFVQEAEERATSDDAVKTTVVFFVGGVTYAEIAALRLMSAQQRNRRFLIATTSVVNGNSLLAQLSHSDVL